VAVLLVEQHVQCLEADDIDAAMVEGMPRKEGEVSTAYSLTLGRRRDAVRIGAEVVERQRHERAWPVPIQSISVRAGSRHPSDPGHTQPAGEVSSARRLCADEFGVSAESPGRPPHPEWVVMRLY